jgi:hypothetical protein
MSAAYRSDLREINEINFARFDAKLEQRFAEAARALEQRLSSLELSLMRQQVVQMRWMIGTWLAVFLAVIGLWFRR